MKFPTLKHVYDRCRLRLAFLAPYRDIIVFVITLFAADAVWKMMISGDERVNYVEWLGNDVTAPFVAVSDHIAYVVYQIVHLFRDTLHLVNDHLLLYDSGSRTSVVWGCSGIKQAFIWFWIIVTARGTWKRKLWYIPTGWVILHLFNILRIVLITLFIEFHQERFEFLHGFLFKYMYYALMFCLWVWWIERISKSK